MGETEGTGQGQGRAVTIKEALVKYLVVQRRPEHVGVGGGEWRDAYDAIILVASTRRPDCYERVGFVFGLTLKADSATTRAWIQDGREVVTII